METLIQIVSGLGIVGIGSTMVPWRKWLGKVKAAPEVVNEDLTAKVICLRHHMSCLPREDRTTGLDACDTLDALLTKSPGSHLEPGPPMPPVEPARD